MTNVIENNAYRILGLDIGVSQKDILKRYKEIINRIKIDEFPEYDLDIQLPKKLRTESTVTEALKKLQSQKTNLREYFFWFQVSNRIDDQAIASIKRGDFTNAINIWKKESKANNSASPFYSKNLALLYCLLLTEKNNIEYLEDSLSCWSDVINSEKFWDNFFRKHSSDTGQAISPETLSEFKKEITKQISDVYTDLHRKHGDNKYVKNFQEIFKMTGEKTEKDLLQPIYQSMYNSINDLQKINIDEGKRFDKKELVEIDKTVDSIQTSLKKLKDIASYNSSQSRAVRDHVASALREVSIALHNKTKHLDMSIHLLKTAGQICGTESLKKMLISELKAIEKNPSIRCWFCKALLKDGDEDYGISTDWNRIVGRENNFWGNTVRVRYQQFKLIVPRCKECESTHTSAAWINFAYVMGSLFVGGGLLALIKQVPYSFLIAIVVGIAAYFALRRIDLFGLKKLKKTKPEGYAEEYPLYKQLINEGWSKGVRPEGVS